MPSTSRRQFLKSLLGTGFLLSSFDFGLDRSNLDAFAGLGANNKKAHRIVSIHLAGGADVFNTFAAANPACSDLYYARRGAQAVARSDWYPLTGDLYINKRLSSLTSIYEAKKMAILPAVGYGRPSHSHFRASEIWHTGQPDRIVETSWTGLPTRTFDVHADISIDGQVYFCESGADDRKLDVQELWTSVKDQQASGKPCHTVLRLNDFDHHEHLRSAHNRSLKRLNNLVSTLWPIFDRDTIFVVYSEFGRTLDLNLDGGTDHGGASFMLLLGQQVKGGVLAEFCPSRFVDQDGLMRSNVDFRSVLGELKQNWIQV